MTLPSAALVAAVLLAAACGGDPSPADEREARERLVARYLDAIEDRDAEAALRQVNPTTREGARDEVAAVIGRLGGRDLDAASVRYEEPYSAFVVVHVTVEGVGTERIELARSGDDWYVALGSATPSRSTTAP